ncbi:Isotrichodermin C-15 hydroxylase [Podospora australis]|uniref:Isotrichodermin C-15 hydroxylase n=1 Tax=Podospora australis TaxID=1536484 RepID=A0AAN7AFT2_9PEZI|nr:Isotrichodermin C-15 hydroxylase [Podospora australis]
MALLDLGIVNILYLSLAGITIYTLSHVIYNLFLHPLHSYPGPLFMRATRLGYIRRSLKGTLSFEMLDLHQKYGPVVRIAPNELAFCDPQAWKDIMGHRTGGPDKQQLEFEKSEKFYRPVADIPVDIVNAKRDEHALLRRTMAHGFSDRAMREQQPLIKGYIDLLMQKLRKYGQGGKQKVDLAAWYNFTTFDVIGDLAFGESFGCLESEDYHPWVKAIFSVARAGVMFQSVAHFPLLFSMLLKMIPARFMEERAEHMEMAMAKLKRRMETTKPRSDLIEGLLKKADEWGLTLEKLQANSGILVIGGSETTATLLSGVTFLLLTNPSSLEKLVKEIRTSFSSEDEIDFLSVSSLPYLLACLDEALRLYPPVPTGLPRVVPPGGASIAGHYVPQGTIVAVHQWAMYHNPQHFREADSFHPERWLGTDERFKDDRKEAFQPFHLGARNCLGRNLAYIEMRLILARVLWSFDLRIAEESRDWMIRQRIFNLWEKGALNVYLTPVVR